jgi:S-adenosylmethionine:tRNA ribosyltransferase-isomerase
MAQRATGGAVELLLLEELQREGPQALWSCMVRSSKRLHQGERLALLPLEGAGARPASSRLEICLHSTVVEGRCHVSLLPAEEIFQHAQMPLPPYINRQADPEDALRYQTVFAAAEGSIAAPTAGLHFTPALLEGLAQAGIDVKRLTLHVGPGTFQPVRCEDIAHHQMEGERYEIDEDTAAAIARAKEQRRPVIAVGTTVVRTLESTGGQAGKGRTSLFITPGHHFRVVEGLMTNFHLPQSTLLMLVSALAGRERVLAAYQQAVQERYRFYSYGDAMLIL